MSSRVASASAALAAAVAVWVTAATGAGTPGAGAEGEHPKRGGVARGLETGFNDNLYLSGDAATREFVFDRTVAARAGIVRINVVWRSIAQDQPANPSDPADPAYRFGVLDTAVREAARRDLDVLLTVYSAPTYAEGPGRPAGTPAGTWRPNPQAYAAFATALATRYSGAFAGLPRVRYYQAWNEPNLTTYLNPQYAGEAAQSPGIYRELLNAFFGAVKGVHADNRVVTAGTGPYGDPPGGTRVRPLAFWRDVLCLAGRRALKPQPCPVKGRFDHLAHHPINTSGGPRRSAIHPDDASTPDLRHVGKILRAAERHRTTGTGRRHQLWVTELWWNSNPPDSAEGVKAKKHARWLEEALFVLWKAGARVVINLQIRDSASDPSQPAAQHTATGILFADGSRKPAWTAFRFPLVAEPGKRRLRAWGRAPAGGRLVIESRRGKSWRNVARLRVGAGDVFKARLPLRGTRRIRARVGGTRSLVWVRD